MIAALTRPVPFALGGLGAFLLELGFAWYPETGRALWRRRSVRVAGTLVVGVVGPAVAWAAATTETALWVLAALAGGLAGYAVLAVVIVTDLVLPPEQWF